MMMRYKLYKHKKQWVIGSAMVMAIALAGMTSSAQAATGNGNNTTEEPAASPSQTLTTPSTSSVATATTPAHLPQRAEEQSQGNRPQSMTGWQFITQNREGRQVFAEPLPRNTTQTETSYGTPINPNNYTVHIGISGLDYTIPPYKLVDGDLRLASNQEAADIPNWHQPALIDGQADNVGTYAVFLSRAGFDHLLAWINGTEENGQWVPQPGVENISLGEYNLNFLLNMWETNRPTYTVTPYLVKVKVVGKAPLKTTGLDLSQYHLQLLSGASSQSSIAPFQTSFDNIFRLQDGDLQVGSGPLADNSYPVMLTDQGWQHVLTGLKKTFNSYGNVDHQPNFICQQADVSSDAVTSLPADEVKTLTRTIIIYLPGKQPRIIKQVATIRRRATVKEGRLVWEDWTSAQWPQLEIPTVAGYTVGQKVIPEIIVNQLTTDQTIVVRYTQSTIVRPAAAGSRQSGLYSTVELKHTGSQSLTNQASDDQQRLPQTGNAKSEVTAIELGLMGLVTMLGFANKKKHEEN